MQGGEHEAGVVQAVPLPKNVCFDNQFDTDCYCHSSKDDDDDNYDVKECKKKGKKKSKKTNSIHSLIDNNVESNFE